MLTSIYVVSLAVVIFIAMIIQLAVKPSFSAKLTGTLIVIAAIGGFFFYGYGYAMIEPQLPIAVLRAVWGVCRMFVGATDYSVVSATPLSGHWIFTFLFWVMHLSALYVTASAAIATIGAEALKKLRLWMARRGDLCIIYGVNSDSVDFAKALAAQTKCSVVFVDTQPDAACTASINKNYVLRTDKNAAKADVQFAKSIGLRAGSRKVTLYALNKDGVSNLRYATNLLKTLEVLEITPKQSSLVIMGTQDSCAAQLQTLGGKYGYGFVTVFQEADLVGRLLVQNYPPCDHVQFDNAGHATEDFEALIIGFGQIGQSVLRSLVMNGQFVGSTFRCGVFAPNCTSVSGFITSTCKELMPHYDIQLYPYDARSSQMYEYLEQHRRTLKYIAICTNDRRLNQEITTDLLQFFERLDLDIPIYQCSHQGILRSTNSSLLSDEAKLYTPDLLRYEKIDAMAMGINQYYHSGTTKTALENWMECDYFSRMSSRASADFFSAILRAGGTDQEQVLAQGWKPDSELLEVLGHMEHQRWCAFHHCMGYSVMSEQEYERRTARYLEEKAEKGSSSIRIGKNTAARTHACLIPWEELDALSARENAITGGHVNYKDMDKRNVLAIEPILRAWQQKEAVK